MNEFNKGESSVELAALYRNVRITAEELNKHKDVMTKECRKYLIGKTCEREKNNRAAEETATDANIRLANEFGYKKTSLQRIIAYACAIDQIDKIAPDIAADILAGKVIRLSGENTVILSKMDRNDILIVVKMLTSGKTPAEIVFKDKKQQLRITKHKKREQKSGKLPRKSVKDTPVYDPNAQVEILAYTIPSWISAVENNFMNTDFNEITLAAQRRLIKELNKLKEVAVTMISILRDEK